MNLFNADQNYLCVSFDEVYLRIAHFKAAPASHEVLRVARRDIRGISEEELAKLVKSLLADFGAKSAQAVCIIPPNMVTTKNIEIPSLDSEEIKSIINLQAGRHTPYSRERSEER